MQKYIDRLVRCGYSHNRAHSTCQNFLRELSQRDLEEYISSIEEETFNVGGIQPESDGKKS